MMTLKEYIVYGICAIVVIGCIVVIVYAVLT